MLNIRESLPEGLLDTDPGRLHEVLPGPMLIHLPGRRERPLFVTVLLHGNEVTGLLALQALLRDYRERKLPRALSIFIGNVAAARYDLRHLDGQPDFNRIWAPGGDTAEHAMAQQVLSEMRRRQPFISVDVHNNTGLNPHYGCVNRLDHRFLHLANLFSRTVVYFIRPNTVQSLAMAQICPAVTLECGYSRENHGVTHAREFLDACLNLSELPDNPVAQQDIDLFHTVATVKVNKGYSFGFGDCGRDICLLPDLDRLNFRELVPGTALALQNRGDGLGVRVVDEDGRIVTHRFFRLEHGQIRTATPVMPSMLTRDEKVIGQDCLCYLMERIDVGAISAGGDTEFPESLSA